MPVSPDFTSVYSHEWEINFTQCAPNGFLKYVDLCNLLQLTAAEHSILGGLSFNDMQAFDQAWVLSRIRIEVDRLPKWQDKVVVKTWIESLQGSSSIRNIEMYLDGKKIAGATSFWVVFNTKIRKAEALALPHEHYEKFPDVHSTEIPFSRINVLKETYEIGQRKVVLSDLDIVNHVNNTKYLEWCLDALDVKLVLQKEIKTFEMNFLRELNLDDEVQLNVDLVERPEYFSVTKNGKVIFALVLERNS
ncbi:acyl-ACP thioesterase [Flavobacterium noncentrifugens]|uniref:Acyl-ACP thioesterase n=1 Tax=Flavobacterium noncentrifugens TaxID=1128970 RepID=A0A1G8WCT5_9FLAO|nr:acyl-ACP thioesterase domain-containing protein [Flavobacterium noncentrifugens]GEP50870.1 acyl-ACP thioesterase [Flavobacterium noncentrifugens]SDJ76088.1 Acyl-ACP thioesterase [Flavobacterium noncentrifugens]